MSRWHGLGGDWIGTRLPHFVALDRKPENGCEIRTAACEESGMMIRLEVVKGCTKPKTLPFEDEFNASSATTLRLVKLWLRPDRTVPGDSGFASVATA